MPHFSKKSHWPPAGPLARGVDDGTVRTFPRRIQGLHVEDVHAVHFAQQLQPLDPSRLLLVRGHGAGLRAGPDEVLFGFHLCPSRNGRSVCIAITFHGGPLGDERTPGESSPSNGTICPALDFEGAPWPDFAAPVKQWGVSEAHLAWSWSWGQTYGARDMM
jgi:hypothetical protein